MVCVRFYNLQVNVDLNLIFLSIFLLQITTFNSGKKSKFLVLKLFLRRIIMN